MTSRISQVAIVIFLSTVQPSLAEQPSFSAMAKVAQSFGATVADFYECKGIWESRHLRRDFLEVIKNCKYSSSTEQRLNDIFHAAASQRSDDIKSVGGECKTDISSRFNQVTELLRKLEKECES